MDKININKIIDDAIAKKDRTVVVFISGENVTVSVSPLDNDSAKWIRATGHSKCSECGFISDYETPFCPDCGEKLGKSECVPENYNFEVGM